MVYLLTSSWICGFLLSVGCVLNPGAMSICICLCGCSFFPKGNAGTPPPVLGDEEAGGGSRHKEEGASRPGPLHSLGRPQAARTARNLSPPHFPAPAPPGQRLCTKGQGPGEGNNVFISSSPWCWEKLYLFWGVGCAGTSSLMHGPAGVTSNPHQNDVFSRGSFPACSICPPSGHPPLPIQI